jgi:large subunit ribosomal protein L22
VSRRDRVHPETTGKSFTASHMHARLSPYKARPVIDLVRGKNVDEALTILEWQERRAAPMIRKVIKSALANASNDLEVKLNRLVVSDARVDGGPLLGGRKRFMARAMGRAFPIHKRTCHISIVLAEAVEDTSAKGRKAGKRAAAKKSKSGAPAASRGAAGAPAGNKE